MRGSLEAVRAELAVVREQQQKEAAKRQEAEIALEQLNVELEKRITEATVDLVQINHNLYRELCQCQSLERELRKRENLLNGFFNAATDANVGMCIVDTDMRFLQINQALATINGYSIEAHLGKTVEELLPEIAPTVIPLWQRVIDTRQCVSSLEISGIVPSQPGVLRYWNIYYFPIVEEADNIQALGAIVVEISEQKKAQNKLRDIRIQLETLAYNIPGVIYTLVEHPDGTNTFKYVSSGCRELLELEPNEIIENADLCFSQMHSDDRYKYYALVKENGERMEPLSYQWRLITPSGKLKWIQENSRPSRRQENIVWHGVLLDISDRVQAEMALRDSEKRFREMFENSPIAYQSLNEKGYYIDVNAELCNLLGYTREEIIGKYFGDFWLPEKKRFFKEKFTCFKRDGSTSLELNLVKKDGTIVTVLLEGRVQRKPNGKFQRTHCVLYNITERTRMEKALKEREAFLRGIGDNLPKGFLYQVVQELDGSDCFTYLSAGVERETGLKIKDVLQNANLLFGRIIEEDLCYMNQKALESLEHNSVFDVQVRELSPQGEIRWFRLCSTPRQLEDGRLCWDGIRLDITELKHTEERLRQNEALLTEAQKVAHIGNWSYDLITKKIYWTEELFHLFNRDLTLGLPTYEEILQYYDTESQHKLNQAVERAIATGEPYKLILRRRANHPDGSICYIEGIGQVEYNALGQPIRIYGTAQDITEQIRYEQALRESELRFRGIFDLMFQFVALLSPDGLMLEVNQRAKDFFRLSPSDLLDKYFWELYVWSKDETREELRTAIARATLGEFIRYEVEVQGPEKQIILVDFSLRPVFDDGGKVVFLIAEGRDITEIKQTEASLKESNRRWRSLLDNVQLIVIELDIQSNVVYINPFFQKITQFSPEEAIGKSWFTTFVPHYLQKSLQLTFQKFLEQGNYPYYQNPIITKSGEERLIAWNNTLLRDLAGNIIGTISIGEDITERHKLERMKAEFVAIVSHELRTPLTAMQAALSLLHEKMIDPTSPEGETTIEIAAEGVDRLVRLVNDILDLERLESGKVRLEKHPCDPADIVNAAIAQIRDLAKQEGVIIEATSLSMEVVADPDRLLQVLLNLLSNAIKFSNTNTTIRLTIEVWESPRPYLLFTVTDQGRGIPAHKLETIFERFQQVDSSDSRAKGGTGLGLAICRNIIEQHGGKIWAESVLGEGSSFHFTLPIVEDMKNEQ